MLGAGFVARRHLDRMSSLPGVRLVGVSDPQQERARALAEEYGGATAEDVHHLVDLGLDCLYVCVPPHQHGEPEAAAIAAGLPVLVEKPLANDLATAEELDRKFREAGLLAAVGYQWRYLDTLALAAKLLAPAPARLVLGSWLDKAPAAPWWSEQGASGGQTVEQLTHVVDVARVLVGEATSVRADGVSDPAGPGDIFHAATSTVRFENEAVGSFTTTCLLRGGYRIALECFAPGLALTLTERDLLIADEHGERLVTAAVDPILEVNRGFLGSVRGEEGDVRVPYAEALRTHRLAFALAEAARTGQTVRPAELVGS